MADLIEQLKTNNLDLKKAEIEGLLYLLSSKEGISFDGLVLESGLPKETLRLFKKSISNLIENPDSENITLTKQGGALLESLSPKPRKWRLFEYSSPELEEKVDEFIRISKSFNLQAKRDRDQFFARPETSVSKALVIKEKGLVEGKKIALLGDDDLLSVSLSLFGGYSSLAVIDVDEDILAVAKRINETKSTNSIRTHLCDLRKSIKSELLGNFDVVVTDPPYTKSGVTLFLNRAVQLLGKTEGFEGKYIFLYYGNSFKSPEKTLKIQEVINRFNLVVEEKIDKFARYNGADSIGNTSSLYILKTTKFTKPVDEEELTLPIYTFENQKEEKFPFVSHIVGKVYGVPTAVINSRSYMLRFLGQFCDLHKLKVVDKKETKFKGNGFSFTLILSSSNLLAHTWPEHGALHIDLVTCAPIYNREKIGANLVSLFKAKNVEIREIE